MPYLVSRCALMILFTPGVLGRHIDHSRSTSPQASTSYVLQGTIKRKLENFLMFIEFSFFNTKYYTQIFLVKVNDSLVFSVKIIYAVLLTSIQVPCIKNKYSGLPWKLQAWKWSIFQHLKCFFSLNVNVLIFSQRSSIVTNK